MSFHDQFRYSPETKNLGAVLLCDERFGQLLGVRTRMFTITHHVSLSDPPPGRGPVPFISVEVSVLFIYLFPTHRPTARLRL